MSRALKLHTGPRGRTGGACCTSPDQPRPAGVALHDSDCGHITCSATAESAGRTADKPLQAAMLQSTAGRRLPEHYVTGDRMVLSHHGLAHSTYGPPGWSPLKTGRPAEQRRSRAYCAPAPTPQSRPEESRSRAPAVSGSPTLTRQHAVLQLLPRPGDGRDRPARPLTRDRWRQGRYQCADGLQQRLQLPPVLGRPSGNPRGAD